MAFQVTDFRPFIERRQALLEMVKKEHRDQEGAILLLADFEPNCGTFQQENSCYYFTGIEEPGIAVLMQQNGKTKLFVPSYPAVRERFMGASPLAPENAAKFGVDEIVPLGDQIASPIFGPFFAKSDVKALINELAAVIAKGKIFTLSPDDTVSYRQQRFALERLTTMVPGLTNSLVDISPFVEGMRRKKEQLDLEYLFKAIEVSANAQEAAAQAIEPDATETEVQAAAEYIFTGSGLLPAYPSVVASGKNAVVLHATPKPVRLKAGDLVVVDMGAQYGHYCADLTRTYPVSGKFSKRQKELYNLALAAQEYIAGLAKPGFYLNNKEQPDKSLTHLARAYFDKHGDYGRYFIHGIGHYLGMDTHDVGDYTKPLQVGDVITIEPGLYIPEEGVGIRIEDDYWVLEDSVICLSEGLPKTVEEIEDMVQATFE